MDNFLWHYTREENAIHILQSRKMFAKRINAFPKENCERVIAQQIFNKLDISCSKNKKIKAVWSTIKARAFIDDIFVASFTDLSNSEYHIREYGNIAIGFRFSQMISDFSDDSIEKNGRLYQPIDIVGCNYNSDEILIKIETDLCRICDNYEKTNNADFHRLEKELAKFEVLRIANSAKPKQSCIEHEYRLLFHSNDQYVRNDKDMIKCQFIQDGIGVVFEVRIFDSMEGCAKKDVYAELKQIQNEYYPRFQIVDMRKRKI